MARNLGKESSRKDAPRATSAQVLGYLLQAAGRPTKDIIPESNSFREIGFEDGIARLGWVIPPSWRDVERALNLFNGLDIVKGKTCFVFSGMGGSINTIKALIDILGEKGRTRLHTIDSLDPLALKELLFSIGDLSQALVIGISKSGTTKETRDLLMTLRERFRKEGLDYREHFLWLTDLPQGRMKIEEADWHGVRFLPIQADNGTDIGGRFTAPHTLIFLVPLFLLLHQDMQRLKELWDAYLSVRERQLLEAVRRAEELALKGSGYFAIALAEGLASALETWAIQLFQESLGSKIQDFNPKTLVLTREAVPRDFTRVEFNISSGSAAVDAMTNMYLLQVLVAAFAYHRGINFVTQPQVEVYKKKMAEVSFGELPRVKKTTLDVLTRSLEATGQRIEQKRFIEAVCYWYLITGQREAVQKTLMDAFPGKEVLVFAGSDWNHHSYQAASKNQDTFFLVLARSEYALDVEGISAGTLEMNVATLRTIAYATYETLKDKAAYAEISDL